MLEVAKESIGDEIRQLDEAGCLGIKEHRNFHHVSELSISVAAKLEFSGESLYSLFCGTFIEHDQTSLRIPMLEVQPRQIHVETTAQLFERNFRYFFPDMIFFLEDRAKKARTAGPIHDSNREGVDHRLLSNLFGLVLPNATTSSHRVPMQLDGMRFLFVEFRRNLIEIAVDPMRISFKDRNSC